MSCVLCTYCSIFKSGPFACAKCEIPHGKQYLVSNFKARPKCRGDRRKIRLIGDVKEDFCRSPPHLGPAKIKIRRGQLPTPGTIVCCYVRLLVCTLLLTCISWPAATMREIAEASPPVTAAKCLTAALLASPLLHRHHQLLKARLLLA